METAVAPPLQNIEVRELSNRFYFERVRFDEFDEKIKSEAFALHVGDDAMYQLMICDEADQDKVIYRVLAITLNPIRDKTDLYVWLEGYLRRKLEVEIRIIREAVEDKNYDYWCIPEEKYPLVLQEIQVLSGGKKQ